MGYWFPTLTVTGGLYAGVTPSGDLSSLFDKLTTISVTASGVVGYATRTDSHFYPDTDANWAGAYGSGDGKFRNYCEQHLNEGNVTVPWMIFTIPNPEGAQYYKQELVVEATINATHTAHGIEWLRGNYNQVYSRVYRREYATPTAIPTVTHTFYQGSLGFPSYYLIDGRIPYDQFFTKNYKFFASYAEYDGTHYLCFGSYQVQEQDHYSYDQDTQTWYPANRYLYALFGIPTATLQAAYGEFKLDENDDPNIDPDPGDDPGDNPPPGPGPKEKEYDPVPIPPVPELTALGAGFITLYSPSSTLMNLFAAEMYSTSILDIIQNYFANVADLIAGLSIVPFFVPIEGFYHHKIGLFQSEVAFPRVSSQFIDVDCGSVDVNHYHNSFLDYAPNTKIMVWLPYIGYQELNADEVMGTSLSIKYRCDILSGACIAFISISGGSGGVSRVIAQFTGNCITQVPTASQSFDTMVNSAINILTGAVGIAAGGAIGAAGAGAAAGAAKAPSATAGAVGAQVGLGVAGTASNIIMGMKPTIARNGTPGSTAGYMGVQKPYLIKIVPRSAIAPNHIQLQGYPSNYGGTLGSLSGYCEVQEIQLNIDPNGTPPNVDEKTEIYRLLKGGVVI